MRTTKIKIRNLYGIKEYDGDGSSVELRGTNGAGKTSVIDAIRLALTNKSNRDLIVRNGETEGEILIETDNGLRINRKIRTDRSDYKSVKKDGHEVGSPEAFLRDIFTPLQLNPVEFMSWDAKKQNAAILDMIEYPWDMNKIKGWFGEIPSWVNYEQNILSVLNDIQSENGEYFQNRQDINRDIRNKRAFVEEIAAVIPEHYDVEKWEKEIRKAALNTEFGNRKTQIEKDISRLQEQIRALETERDSLEEKLADKLAVVEQEYKANIAQYDAEVEAYSEYRGKEPQDVSLLVKEAEEMERMKSHINEYRRMQGLQQDIRILSENSQHLTSLIEKARSLPGEILTECKIPIKGLSIKDGVPLINGLPISNLSDGEKLDLCIDVAIQKPNGLQLILIDGVEKLSKGLRDALYRKCQAKGLQFIATRTTDDDAFTVVSL